MNSHDLIKSKLEEHPWFRERRARLFGISKLLIRKYHLEEKIDPKTLEDIIAESATLDRSWRKVLSECPHLQGSDYGDKREYEEKKEIELGYEVGYHNDLKQSKLL